MNQDGGLVSVTRVLQIANEMEAMGIIGKYAIAGSIAVIYYSEPIETHDFDIFYIHNTPPGQLVLLSPLYDFFRMKGLQASGYTVQIGGIPVQIVPAIDALDTEAIEQSIEIEIYQVKTRIVSLEHLIAMKLSAGRPKDFAHLTLLLDHVQPSQGVFQSILKRFTLTDKWEDYRRKFYGG